MSINKKVFYEMSHDLTQIMGHNLLDVGSYASIGYIEYFSDEEINNVINRTKNSILQKISYSSFENRVLGNDESKKLLKELEEVRNKALEIN